MIQVEVHMHGNLRRFLPEGVASTHLEVADDSVVADIIRRLGAEDNIWVAAIDDKAVPLSTRLVDGVALEFFPFLTGG